MHRFFLPIDSFLDGFVKFPPAVSHQLSQVLRMQEGDKVLALDNSGWEFEVVLTKVDPKGTEGTVQRKSLTNVEPRTKITIYQAVLKGDRFDYVLQKGTEIGVVGFVPMLCDRCIIASLGDVSEGKLERWNRIVREAAEQAGRGKLPALHSPVLFDQACAMATGVSFMPWEEEKTAGLRVALSRWDLDIRIPAAKGGQKPPRPQRPFSVNIFIGPEGGFSPPEVKAARSHGIRTVSLGPRILRAETAGLVTAAAILYEWGDLGG
jgi:16S rRNA (uracil1498-N3)-methyltransferase